ncbi:MAG: GNAT family N-acetyltransferase [Steroidobacteraceae bacterium]
MELRDATEADLAALVSIYNGVIATSTAAFSSVPVRSDCRGGGIGSKLLEALFPRAAVLGKHMMIAAVDAANAPSIRFHERLGFHQAGCLREVGRKFDRWLDLVFLQRRIGA